MTNEVRQGDVITTGENTFPYIFACVDQRRWTFINLYTGQRWTDRPIETEPLSFQEVASIFHTDESLITNHGKLRP